MMKNDTFESLVFGPKCAGPKSIGPKYAPGRSMHRAKVFTGPKFSRAKVFPGRSCFGPRYFRAKVSVGPKWSLGQTGCEPLRLFRTLKYVLQQNKSVNLGKPGPSRFTNQISISMKTICQFKHFIYIISK